MNFAESRAVRRLGDASMESGRDAAMPIAPDETETLHSGLSLRRVNGVPVVPDVASEQGGLLGAKRAADFVFGLLAIALLSPLLLILALAVRLTSPGPVLFVQDREGLNGQVFQMYKFRSLNWTQSDPSGLALVQVKDNRLTPVGGFLRRTSFDELPQLFNIVKGDMSIVGPRPHVPDMMVGNQRYDKAVPYYALRHGMKPGLTGWAQANGLRGPLQKVRMAKARVDHDLAYIANFSFWLDMKIIVWTFWSEIVRLGRGH